jgi:putative transposase
VLVSFAYLVACRLLALVLLLARGDRSNEVDLLVLRHVLSILRRQTRRPQLTESDRLVLAAQPGAGSAIVAVVLCHA